MLKRYIATFAIAATVAAPPLVAPASAQRGRAAAAHAVVTAAQLRQAVATPGRPAAATGLDEVRRPAEVLQWIGLRRGDRVLDYFTGTGYYAEIIGRAVGPRGSVTAWNSTGFMGNERLRTALTELTGRTPNVTVQAGDLTALDFGANSYDLALLHLVYHDAYWQSEQYHVPRIDPNTLTRALYRAVKPGGSVVVIDHVAAPGGDTRAVVEQYHRIDPATIRADFQRAGFRFAGESSLLRVPTDPHNVNVFDPSIRGRTDRVMYRFTKPLRRRR